MSSSVELAPMITQETSPVHEYPESRSNINFWLLVGVIGLIVLLIILTMIFVLIPANKVKNDVTEMTSTVKSLSSKANKIVTDGDNTKVLVDDFRNSTQTDFNNLTFDICNLKIVDTIVGREFVIFDGRRDLPQSFCENVPTAVPLLPSS